MEHDDIKTTKKLPDSFVVDRYTKTYPTELGSQPFRPDDIELFKLDKTNTLKHYYVSKFDELKNEYIKLMEDISINEKIYKAKYSFQPIVGQDYFLYLDELGEEFLSIIAPKEWGRKKFEHLGTFQLQTDGRWMEIKSE
jgi:hypothetical protein